MAEVRGASYVEVHICPHVAVLRDPVAQIDRVYTCAQRSGHTSPHNEMAPRDWRAMAEAGCTHTAWDDHPAPGYECPDAKADPDAPAGAA